MWWIVSEVARHLAWMGAEVIFQPTATGTSDRDQEVVLARANAIVNQVYVVNVNMGGRPGPGRSAIADPEGHLLQLAECFFTFVFVTFLKRLQVLYLLVFLLGSAADHLIRQYGRTAFFVQEGIYTYQG